MGLPDERTGVLLGETNGLYLSASATLRSGQAYNAEAREPVQVVLARRPAA